MPTCQVNVLEIVKGPTFNRIVNYRDLDLTCFHCGTDLSVEYEYQGETFCNCCILSVISD